MEGVPFSSSYATAVWLGHATGMWERKVWTSWSFGSSCADWQRPRTLSAMLEDSIQHHHQPHPPPRPSWLLSTCGGHHYLTVSWQNRTSLCRSSSRAKVQHPPRSDWWRQVRGKVPSFCTKAAEMSTLGEGHQIHWEGQTSGRGMGTEREESVKLHLELALGMQIKAMI